MITNRKFIFGTKLKILAFIPLVTLLFLGCINGRKTNVIAAVAPTKMNVLYLGIDNPLTIVVSGYNPSELAVSINNGTITGQNGLYIAHPAKADENAVITVSCKGKEIQKSSFRVKTVPDPVAKVAGIKGSGSIDKNVLLAQSGVFAVMENFDFDLQFIVSSFTVSAMRQGFVMEKNSNDNRFTQEQLELIKQVDKGQKIYISDIKAIGPDGAIRALGSIDLKLK